MIHAEKSATPQSSFGSTLRQERIKAGFSLREFASRISYSPGHVSHIETGAKIATVKFVQACEEVLSLSGLLTPLLSSNSSMPPAQLPPVGGPFVGRYVSVRRVVTHLLGDRGVVLIDGPPGIGKTAVAVRCASDPALTHHYPDGILFADLHGFTPSRSPVDPADVCEDFLQALDVPQDRIPAKKTVRYALLRSMLANRRVLIVLDNAANADQVRPLLPGEGQCGVIVTSRLRSSGLAIRDGAARVSLRPLRRDEAVELLTQIIGERAKNSPDATAELAELCSCWPLALRVIGDKAVTRDHVTLTELRDELRCAGLDALSAEEDDQASTLRATFDASYQALSTKEKVTFRLIGLHPGSRISVAAAAALTGQEEHSAQAQMKRLSQAHLVSECQRDYYQLHDLLRWYAVERTTHEDTETTRNMAITRLLGYYLRTIAVTVVRLAVLRPDARRRREHDDAVALDAALSTSHDVGSWSDKVDALGILRDREEKEGG